MNIGDMSVNTYRASFPYYFGEGDAKIRPYLMGGLGATSFRRGRLHPSERCRRDHLGRFEVLQHVGRRREQSHS